MRACPNCPVRVGFWCRRDGAGVRDRRRSMCSGCKAPEEIEGFTLNDLDQLREDQAGRWLRTGLFAVRLEARRLHLRSQARRDPRRRQVGDRARRIRAGAGRCVPGPAARALRPGLSAAQLHHRRRRQAHALPMRGVSPDARWREAPGRLPLRHRPGTTSSSSFGSPRLRDSNTEAAARKYVAAWIPGAVGPGRQRPRRAGRAEATSAVAARPGAACTAPRARRRGRCIARHRRAGGSSARRTCCETRIAAPDATTYLRSCHVALS